MVYYSLSQGLVSTKYQTSGRCAVRYDPGRKRSYGVSLVSNSPLGIPCLSPRSAPEMVSWSQRVYVWKPYTASLKRLLGLLRRVEGQLNIKPFGVLAESPYPKLVCSKIETT